MSNYRLPEEERVHPDFRPQGSKVVMICGNGSGITIPTDNRGGGSKNQASLVAGTVSLNTSDLRCPTIKIDFSSMINYQVKSRDGDYLIRLAFQLSKACGGHKIPLNTWIYEKEVERCRLPIDNVGPPVALDANGPSILPPAEVDMLIKEAFGFTWCECNPCPDCCLYVVEIVDVDSHKIRGLSLTNVGINAMIMAAGPSQC
ncbi:MAG: DUF4489 domain-containing protein [Syntrophomonadaceae bacterium]|nr:DUF4489 domain-containing protein [Syntrophomonadaceae bacterium]